MKKTFTININGRVFHIDDDAHERLNNYLNQLNRYFGNDPDAKEIVQDIEARISELFSQDLKSGVEVITLTHVDQVISRMGMPEAISDAQQRPEKSQKKVLYTRGKKLYRDPNNKILGGVCSGLGAYFNIDPVVIRVLFALLVILGAGTFFLVYIILWIVVPRAANTAERLEMKGKEVNISTISKSIKEEVQDVKENYKNMRNSPGREGLNEIGNFILVLLKAVLKIAVVFIGALLVIMSIIILVSLIFSFFIADNFMGIFPWPGALTHYFGLFVNGNLLSWFSFGLILVIGIPLIMLAYLGLKLLFKFKTRNNAVGLSLLAMWIIGLIILIFTAVSGVNKFRDVSTSTRQEPIITPSDTLYLKLGSDEISDYVDKKIQLGDLRIATMNDKPFLVGNPEMTIQKSENNNCGLVIRSRARGGNAESAQKNAREILYKVDQNDSLLIFQPWYVIPGNSAWHLQNIQVILKIPEGKTVFLDENMKKIIHDISNTSNTLDDEMVNEYWTMKSEGLVKTDKKVQIKSNK